MIFPSCQHTASTKAKPDGNLPRPTGWVLCCRDCFERSIRANMMLQSDLKVQVGVQDRLRESLGTIQSLLADIEDMKLSRRTAFIRCGCGRLKELNVDCRGCGV